MKSPVIIKGNKWGIRLIIAPEATLEAIIGELETKLQNTGNYYKNIKPIKVAFDGKILTEDEKEIILNTLRKFGLNAKQDKPDIQNASFINNILPDKDGLFYIGNLKSGQSINALCSIVIVGNVEQGASVFSNGNIIIIGSLGGYAQAGLDGREDAFIYTLVSGRNN